MARDIKHSNIVFNGSSTPHKYSKNVHLLANPYLQTILAKFGRPEVKHPLVNSYVRMLYNHLMTEVINNEFPTTEVKWDTRMKEFSPLGVFEGEVVAETPVVVVDLARAGTWPSHICFDSLNYLINPDIIREDHFYLNRKTNDAGEVIGVDASGSKIGGGKEGAIVLFPDPMGATGGTISHSISHYKENVPGKELKFISIHLVITPEYIQRLTKEHPDVQIYALRLDRGHSDEETLKTIPGTHPDKEKGLNEIQYIVPGLGGVGEVLSNSYI
ncbi:MAG: hypothetical protein KAG61_09305 [Bacteriovoracaceae bacterium]|nr:hypothetical protein [Bacteriovoracaceae bacterium]